MHSKVKPKKRLALKQNTTNALKKFIDYSNNYQKPRYLQILKRQIIMNLIALSSLAQANKKEGKLMNIIVLLRIWEKDVS
jgi:hypothetical protein